MQDITVPQLIINKLTKEQYESIQEPSDTQLYLITDEDESSGGGASRNIGEIVASTLPLVDGALHLLDGSLIQGNGIYKGFVDYIAALYTENPTANYWTTETDWLDSIIEYGVCGKFVYDSVNNTVRLPKITGIVEGTTDLTALGDLVEAGLPNIAGKFIGGNPNGTISGAFEFDNDSNSAQGGSNYREAQMSFDASRSNPIYGNSSTVQPQAIKCYYYIVIATTVKTDVEVDIDEITADLSGKADVDLTNCSSLALVHCVVETYVNGTSWYRLYDDGWCEQGGRVVASAANVSVSMTLLKTYRDTNYYINLTTNTTNTTFNGAQPNWVSARTISGFTAHMDGYAGESDWIACGYIA